MDLRLQTARRKYLGDPTSINALHLAAELLRIDPLEHYLQLEEEGDPEARALVLYLRAVDPSDPFTYNPILWTAFPEMEYRSPNNMVSRNVRFRDLETNETKEK